MTYADDIRAAQDAAVEKYVGDLAAGKDQEIAALVESRDAANARASALEQQVADLTAQLDACQSQQPTPSPSPSPATLWVGATLRGTDNGNALAKPRPVWDIVRTYNQADALTAVKAGKGRTVATSYGSFLGGPGWSKDSTKISSLRSQITGLPDVPGVRVADTHEFDNPNKYGADYVTYLADAAAFAQVVRSVSASRQNPLTIFRCCMAYSLSQPARKIDEFYTRDPENYDEFGPDVYKIPDIDLAVKKALQYGKPLCVPEMGPLSNVDQTDPAILDYMQQGVAAWTGVATWVAWFDKNGAGADLDQYPNALQFWASNVTL